MHLTCNEGKSLGAERFIRTLQNKIYKYMASVSQNVYIDKSDDIGNEYNNTYDSTFKMKSIDVEFGEESNENYPKLDVVYHVRILKLKKYCSVDKCNGTLEWIRNLERFMKENCKKQI